MRPLTQAIIDSIDHMMRWMKQKRYSPSTIGTYVSFVRQFFGRTGLEPNQVNTAVIEQYNYQYFIQERRSYSSQNQWINAVKLYLRVNNINVGDLDHIQRPRKEHKLPNVLSQEEVQSIFQATTNLKHRTLLMLIYGAGLRIGEALNLTIHDIRSKEHLIYIRGGKGRKDRRVPLSDKLLEALRTYYKSYKPKNYLFEGMYGGQYSNKSAMQVLKRSAIKAGIERKISLHTLRHSYATHLTNKGVNIQYLQEILGHNSPKTTMLYTHLSGKDISKIISPLDDMDL